MTRQEIFQEQKGILDRKLKPYIDRERLALQSALKAANELSQQILKVHERMDSIRDERDRLEAEVEQQTAQGNSPGAQLSALRLKTDEVDALKKQANRLRDEQVEAEKKIQPAANALDQAIRSRITELRDAEEEKIQAILDDAQLRFPTWEDSVRAFYDDCGLIFDKKQGGRVLKFYGLNFEGLQLHVDNARDAGFWLAKKPLRDSRKLKG